MAQMTTMIGNNTRYGTLNNRTQMPMSGRLMTSNMALPTHIDAMMPQNSSGWLTITRGPGAMPWTVMAPIIIAMLAPEGMPSARSGMNEVCAPALLADSGPATPSMAPRPNRDGSLATFFSSVYDAKDDSI